VYVDDRDDDFIVHPLIHRIKLFVILFTTILYEIMIFFSSELFIGYAKLLILHEWSRSIHSIGFKFFNHGSDCLPSFIICKIKKFKQLGTLGYYSFSTVGRKYIFLLI
jgi:hypothetical protein